MPKQATLTVVEDPVPIEDDQSDDLNESHDESEFLHDVNGTLANTEQKLLQQQESVHSTLLKIDQIIKEQIEMDWEHIRA